MTRQRDDEWLARQLESAYCRPAHDEIGEALRHVNTRVAAWSRWKTATIFKVAAAVALLLGAFGGGYAVGDARRAAQYSKPVPIQVDGGPEFVMRPPVLVVRPRS